MEGGRSKYAARRESRQGLSAIELCPQGSWRLSEERMSSDSLYVTGVWTMEVWSPGNCEHFGVSQHRRIQLDEAMNAQASVEKRIGTD
jgi:hypothetical protein